MTGADGVAAAEGMSNSAEISCWVRAAHRLTSPAGWVGLEQAEYAADRNVRDLELAGPCLQWASPLAAMVPPARGRPVAADRTSACSAWCAARPDASSCCSEARSACRPATSHPHIMAIAAAKQAHLDEGDSSGMVEAAIAPATLRRCTS